MLLCQDCSQAPSGGEGSLPPSNLVINFSKNQLLFMHDHALYESTHVQLVQGVGIPTTGLLQLRLTCSASEAAISHSYRYSLWHYTREYSGTSLLH